MTEMLEQRKQRRLYTVRHVMLALIVGLPLVGYPVWCLIDRQPPYVREHGEVVPAEPHLCDLPKGRINGLAPGTCATVRWTIRSLRHCDPDTPNNIARRIRDSENVSWPIGPVRGLVGTDRQQEPPRGITRYFLIPSGAQPGRAVYESTATFACNPLQYYAPLIFWPIRVSEPSIEFVIGVPPRPVLPPAQRQGFRRP